MIRMAITHDDVHKVAAFMKRFETASKFVKVDVEYTTGRYWQMIQSGMAVMFILESDGEMIGGLGAVCFPDLHDGVMTAVETFWYVDPSHRGSGMKLLDAYDKWSQLKNCKRDALIHLADSFPESLHKIYDRRGYELVESHYMRSL